MTKETIAVDKEKYYKLLERASILDALEAAGVDNWEGYEEAMRYMYPDDEDL